MLSFKPFAAIAMLPFFAAVSSNAPAASDPEPDRASRDFTPDPLKKPVERHKLPDRPVPPPPPRQKQQQDSSKPASGNPPNYQWPPGFKPPSQ